MGDSNFPMLDLLEVICEKSPPDMDVPNGPGEAFENYIIRLCCPQHLTHPVSPLGFLLLEEVEAGFSSALQEVELVDMPESACDELVPALGSRVERQQGKMVSATTARALRPCLLCSRTVILDNSTLENFLSTTSGHGRWLGEVGKGSFNSSMCA